MASSITSILSQSQQPQMRLLLLFGTGNLNINGSKKNIMMSRSSSKLGGAVQCSGSVTNGWTEFANKVSGEWDGFGADFTAQGVPIELPEYVVPEAYREWEVKVFDWQTQCPTLADPDPDPSFKYKLIRLLPTVGCEADAATRYSVEERNIASSSCTAFAYQPTTGCYVAAWSSINNLLELEHCLIHPRDRESRVRIIQVLRLLPDHPELHTLKVFHEHWYGPFRDGAQLGGCAIRDSAFASTPPLDASQLIGVWEGPAATFLNSPHPSPKQHNVIQQLLHTKTRTIRDAPDLVLLPKQLWCCLKITEDESCYCEAGWLLDKGSAITSNCILSKTGDLKEISISYEHATSESILQ